MKPIIEINKNCEKVVNVPLPGSSLKLKIKIIIDNIIRIEFRFNKEINNLNLNSKKIREFVVLSLGNFFTLLLLIGNTIIYNDVLI